MPGDCGDPVASDLGEQYPLLGLHMAKLGLDAVVVPIFKEDQVDFGQLQSLAPDAEGSIDPMIPGEQIPGAKYLGKWEGKTSIAPSVTNYTPLFPKLIAKYPDEIKVPPNMSNLAQKNRNVATHNIGPSPHHSEPIEIMSKSGWSADFAKLPRKGVLWDFDTALFGDPSREIRSMASTSKYVGWGLPGKKSDHVNFNQKFASLELRERTAKYYEAFKLGTVTPICQQFKKDELLPVEKVRTSIPMTRNVNGHDLAYNVALRMLTGDVVDMITAHHSQGATAIGVNPHSADWHNIATQAYKHPNSIGGDLSKQEAVTILAFSLAFARMLIDNTDCTELEQIMILNACKGLNGYLFIVGSSVYETMRGHSSGHLLTTLFNSYMVWAGHKFIFEIQCPELKFAMECALKVLGDDSRGSVTDKVKERFNMTTLAEGFMKYFGITYTSPGKTAEVMPFIVDAEEDHFLGRDFVRLDNGVTAGRLRMVAIRDMLYYTTKVPGITKKEMIEMRSQAAFYELSLYPKKHYDKVRAEYLGAFDEDVTLLKCKPGVPTWRANRNLVLQNYHGCDKAQDNSLPIKIKALSC